MRRVSITRYVAAFAITLLIFLIGMMLGQLVAERKIERLRSSQEGLWSYLLGLELQSRLVAEYICDVDIFQLTREKVEMGREVEYLENALGKTHEDVIAMKKQYTLLSINQYLLVEKWISECEGNMTIILFFYSNIYNASASAEQGYVLDYIYTKSPESVVIYAFDVDIENPALNTLKNLYKIKMVPSIVVNDVLYEGFQEKEKIDSLIGP